MENEDLKWGKSWTKFHRTKFHPDQISPGSLFPYDHSYDPVTQKDYYRMAAIFQNTEAVDFHNISYFKYRPLPGINITQAYESIGHMWSLRALKREIADLEKKINSGHKELSPLKVQKDKEFANIVNENSKLPVALAVQDYKKFAKGFIRVNGTEKKGAEVERGGPLEFIPSHLAEPVPASQSGRLQFADWLADAKHPLTARVYVNRIWARLFGKGIVKSLDNFGVSGQKPTHPELLDFLAADFIKEGWSTKKLIRQIVLSDAYKRSIKPTVNFEEKDPANDLLSFFPRRRMTAEAIRDSILRISGELNSTHLRGIVPADQLQSSKQRSIFLPIMRDEGKNYLLDAFDFPDPGASTGERNVSDHPKQSLFLMNSPFILRQSYKAAGRLLNDCQGQSNEDKFYRAAMLSYAREFSDSEKEIFKELLTQTLDEKAAWARIFHLVFCSVDFRFLK